MSGSPSAPSESESEETTSIVVVSSIACADGTLTATRISLNFQNGLFVGSSAAGEQTCDMCDCSASSGGCPPPFWEGLQALPKMGTKKIDVVIPLGVQSAWGSNEELRYCLRSLEKYFVDLGNVYIVTDTPPEWISGQVIVIELGDKHKRNKDANLIDKVLLACKQPQISDPFVRGADDYLLLKPVGINNILPTYTKALDGNAGGSRNNKWYRRLNNTYHFVKEQGCKNPKNFDTHSFAPVRKNEFIQIVEKADYAKTGMCINSLYYNLSDQHAMPLESKVSLTQPIHDVEQIRHLFKNHTFLNTNGKGLTLAAKQVIQEFLPEKSRFEI